MFSYQNKKGLVLFSILCLILSVFPPRVAMANGRPVITPGVNPGAIIQAQALLLNFNNGEGNEVLLGKAGLAEGERAQVDFSSSPNCDGVITPSSWQASNRVTLDYSYTFGKLLLEVVASNRYCLEYPIGRLSPFDYLELDVNNRAENGNVSFKNVRLNGVLLGDFSGSGMNSWNFTGLDYSLGFRLEGDLVLTGDQPNGDLNHLGIKMGYLTEDIQGPITTDVSVDPYPVTLNGITTVNAVIDDRLTGGSVISAAEFSLDEGATWQTMNAIDGVFDQAVEAVSAEFIAASVELESVCVRGIDGRGNIGERVCASLSVVYQFEGFFRPVQMNVINSARAGRTIPIKWRLRDATGNLVTDRLSFEGLYSYPVDCKTWTGDPSRAIREFSANSKGLLFTEDGYWQYNWKTPKEYAGTCRIMYVELAGDAVSPILQLMFR